MSTAQHKTLNDFIKLKRRNALCHVIRAATELGIFRALVPGQRNVQQLAKEIDADETQLALLMEILAQTELVENYGDDFALSSLARLIPGAFYDFGDSYWKHLVGHVKTGSSLHEMEHVPLSNPDFIVNQASEEWTLTPAALTTIEALDIGKSRKGLNIIELGCGSAVIGATLLHADPTSKLTLVDLPSEIERARETVDAVKVGDRTTLISADNWRDFEAIDLSGTEVPEDIDENAQELIPQPTYDLVIMTRRVHLEPLEDLQPLFKKIGALLLPKGGELVVIDSFPGQEQGAEYFPIASLEFGLRHSPGTRRHPREIESILKNAGFPRVQFTHLPAEPYLFGLVVGEK